MQPKTLLFIGRSGAGKGTQSKKVMEYLESEKTGIIVYYLETGAHFREFVKGESYTSARSKVIYYKAERQPDFLAVWNWADLLVRYFTDSMHLVMDGMPRSLSEAQILRTALDFYGIKNLQVIHVNVSPEWSRDRLNERHRLDDKSPEEIEKKIAWFDTDVLPAIEYFKQDPFYSFIEVNGEQAIDDVYNEIFSKLKW